MEDEQTAEDRRRRRRGDHVIWQAPTGPHPGGGGGSDSGSGTSGSSSSTTSSGGGGNLGTKSSKGDSGKNGPGGTRKIGQSYLDQANNLEVQARALRHALNIDFKKALRIKLGDVNEALHSQNRTLMDGYRQRVASLEGAFEDNTKAAASQTLATTSNQLRERTNALNQIAIQGAGESDAAAAQLMSLRNWQQNQAEVDRAKFDTLRSINSSLTDLNVDTKTARVNNVLQAQADKQSLWTNYFNQRSETYTNLGNTLGQMADYRDTAKAYGVGKGGNAKSAGGAFMHASKELGKSWDAPGVPKRLLKWQGHDDFGAVKKTPNLSRMLSSAPTVELNDAPEGASLRKWSS